MSDGTDARLTLWLTSETKSQVESRLGYRDSMSGWVRDAVHTLMYIEDAIEREGIELPEDDDDRERLLREIAFDGVKAQTER